jgi:ATP-dependent Clp protease ATP-binding subunit ClpC
MATFKYQNSLSQKFTKEKAFISSPLLKLIFYVIYILAIASIFAYILLFLNILILGSTTLRLCSILIALAMLVFFIDIFFKTYYFRLTPSLTLKDAFQTNANIADYLDEASRNVVERSFRIAGKYKYLEINPVILLSAIQETEEGRYIFARIGAGSLENMSELISQELTTLKKGDGQAVISADTQNCIIQAAKYAVSAGRKEITIGDILLGILDCDKAFSEIVFALHLKKEDIVNIVNWYLKLKSKVKNIPFWQKKNFGPAIGRGWSYGYSNVLNYFAYDLTDVIENSGEISLYGRKDSLADVERILSKTSENNVLLIGDKGIGKKTLVYALIQKISKGEAMKPLANRRIFQLDVGALISGAGQKGALEARLTSVLNEVARVGNAIIFVEDFHNLTSSRGDVGQINAAEIIHPYLKGNIQIIGTTNLKNYHMDIEANPGIKDSFEKIEVSEPNQDETREILEEKVASIEYKYKVFFTYQDLQEIIRLADRYIKDKPMPIKAIDLTDEVAVKASQSGQKLINTKIIDEIVTQKTKVPVSEPEGGEKEKLLHLEDFLHQRIINQKEAIDAIANAMRRARSGLVSKDRPVGSFLFLGPTGVGKTETAKALAAAYFGSEKNMIRLDMSEFQEQSSVERLLGTPPKAGAEGTKGELVDQVKDNPFSLVLVDEIEKAHPQILTLFLQVLDEGYLGAATGEKIDFKNTIIICTSNAGSELIRKSLQSGVTGDDLKKQLLEYLQSEGIYKPEFLNRFDGVIAFHPLNSEQIKEVAKLMLKQLSGQMKEKEITLEFTDAAINKLAKIGFDPVYGARPMRRTIQEKIEDSLAKKLISGEIKRGDKVVLDEKDI